MHLLSDEHLAHLLARFETDDKFRDGVRHNLGTLRRIRGGLEVARAHRMAFDPRDDYWRQPQRRILVAWFAATWTERLAPVKSLRTLALHLFRHFDQITEWGGVPFRSVEYDEAPGGWLGICETMRTHLARMVPPDPALWEAVRAVWPRRAARSLVETLDQHFAWAGEDHARWARWEPRFRYRATWFPYLGTANAEVLQDRQAFWFGFLNLWTSANSYRRGGSLSFGPMLQNTPVESFLAPTEAWAQGLSPAEVPLLGTRTDEEHASDRSNWTVVVEVFGFLNLHQGPFLNAVSTEPYAQALAQLGETVPDDPYARRSRLGACTRSFVDRHPAHRTRLAAALGAWQQRWPKLSGFHVKLEWQPGQQARRRANQDADAVVDAALARRVREAADETFASWSEAERATCALHLLIDAATTRLKDGVPLSAGEAAQPEGDPSNQPVVVHEPPGGSYTLGAEVVTLPEALWPDAQRALAYLRARFHVLLAGVPGTGKTTIAQFVGHAWNHDLDQVPTQLRRDELPRTTVGNSAWSPFHTIGGMVPTGEAGAFQTTPGVFLDRKPVDGDRWQLFPGALVLDEMNRADLDRCIGELYPLLSHSVFEVWPAGIPGMRRIQGHARFRLLATVNDSTLDDIVFPISEGLIRRFQRIEIAGAEREDVVSYLLGRAEEGDEGDLSEREGAALDAVGRLYVAARDANLLSHDRLPVGVGWFRPLQAWLRKELVFPTEFVEGGLMAEARDVLINALRPARAHGLSDVLGTLDAVE